MATQKIVDKSYTFELQRQTINSIGEDVYNVLTGNTIVSSVVLENGTVLDDTSIIKVSNALPFVASSFSSLEYRAAKYLLMVKDDTSGNIYYAEYLVAHNGATIQSSLISSVAFGTNPMSGIDFAFNGNDIELTLTPDTGVSNSTTKITRTLTSI